PLGGPGDLHVAPLEVLRRRRNLPVSAPDRLGGGEEIEVLAPVERFLSLAPGGEQLLPPALEPAVERLEEGQGIARKDLLGALGSSGEDVQGHDAAGLPQGYGGITPGKT